MTTHPTIDTEQAVDLVLGQMREVLRNPEFSATDDFFESGGGDSVLAAGLAGRLQRGTGLDIPTSFVFTYPTAAELGVALAEESQAR